MDGLWRFPLRPSVAARDVGVADGVLAFHALVLFRMRTWAFLVRHGKLELEQCAQHTLVGKGRWLS